MKIKDIKFKAKRLDGKGWVCGYFYEENGNTYIIENRQKESKLNRNPTYQVDPSTVCQFTGLKDSEGKEIWEGDILRDVYFGHFKHFVIFANGTFLAQKEGQYSFVIAEVKTRVWAKTLKDIIHKFAVYRCMRVRTYYNTCCKDLRPEAREKINKVYQVEYLERHIKEHLKED